MLRPGLLGLGLGLGLEAKFSGLGLGLEAFGLGLGLVFLALALFKAKIKVANILPNTVYLGIIRLDALALSVIATTTWLGGWVAGWLSHSDIVSKPLNLSENFFDHLKAPSL